MRLQLKIKDEMDVKRVDDETGEVTWSRRNAKPDRDRWAQLGSNGISM